MKPQPKSLLFPLLLLVCVNLTACLFNDPNSEQNTPLLALHRQRIAHSSLVIYKFVYEGSFATTSYYMGWTILDSSIPFARNKIERLPADYFSERPMPYLFKMINIRSGTNRAQEKDTLMTPDRQYSEEIKDVRIEVKEYRETYGSPRITGLMSYQFDGIKETDDSLTLFNVVEVAGGQDFPSTVSFAKGNIEIVDSSDNKINHIDITRVIIQRGKIYKPTKPFEIVPDQPVVGIATYRFYPKSPVTTSLLSDYGIFKRIK